ncbi:unnamed protein product [Arabis nemorensis]|uniref:Ribonucleoside-diphosphate reductase n=1 Tax=Arabis nemorensis TaxID=586526 RepID=A0A565BLF8_9BRAS|nr:unnamed protein product [Arabis nemorensis]
MYVVNFDQISARLKEISYGLSSCDIALLAHKVFAGVYDGLTTSQLDELAADTAAAMSCDHPDYATLAARIGVSKLQKNTKKSFSEMVYDMSKASLIANANRLDSEIIYDRDFQYDYFGFKTLERLYLLKVQGKVVERPQHMLMRVVVGIHKDDIDSAIKTYHWMSQRWFTHASPTLCNAGTPRPQLSSCFLICMKDDNMEGIYETLKECAVVSNSGGSIGVSVHNARATGSYISIVPMLRVFNDTARYIDEGGGKRSGTCQPYTSEPLLYTWSHGMLTSLSIWSSGRSMKRCQCKRRRGMFYALRVPDLSMERVKSYGEWSLFCPNEALGLADCLGEEFERLYTNYEREAGQLNKDIFETIYYHALKASSELAARYGVRDIQRKGLQPDMWNVTPSTRWDWYFRDMLSKNGRGTLF